MLSLFVVAVAQTFRLPLSEFDLVNFGSEIHCQLYDFRVSVNLQVQHVQYSFGVVNDALVTYYRYGILISWSSMAICLLYECSQVIHCVREETQAGYISRCTRRFLLYQKRHSSTLPMITKDTWSRQLERNSSSILDSQKMRRNSNS